MIVVLISILDEEMMNTIVLTWELAVSYSQSQFIVYCNLAQKVAALHDSVQESTTIHHCPGRELYSESHKNTVHYTESVSTGRRKLGYSALSQTVCYWP